MTYKPLAPKYRKSSPLVFNVDYFDYATNAGYKIYYLGAYEDSAGSQYIITNSTIGSDSSYGRFGANGTTNTDFDLTFGNPATIAAAPMTLSFNVKCENTKTFNLTATIYHVAVDTTETQIGQGIAPQTAGAVNQKRTLSIDLSRKRLSKGEKLRVTLDIVSTGAGTYTFLDPSGGETIADTTTGATLNAQFTLNIPFEVDL
jgi:hypothetical protein